MYRRDFFKTTFGLASLGLAGRYGRFGLLNAMTNPSSDYRAMVCIFLFGGNDANNLVVPLDDARYKAYAGIRNSLALAQGDLLPVELASKEVFGLHPKMLEVQKLAQQKSVAFVANIGTLVQPLTKSTYNANKELAPSNLFSHSDQQMQWQTSVPRGSSGSGWAGRVADQVGYLNTPSKFPTIVSMSGNNIFATGEESTPAILTPGAAFGLKGYDNSSASRARSAALQELLSFDSGVRLVHEANGILKDGINNSDTLSKALAGSPALKTVFPANNSLANQLKEVAQLMQVRDIMGMKRQIFFTSIGSFDTHTAQLATQDTLLGEVSAAIGAFYQALQELGVENNVVTFTESDFARTMQPNSNGGTDHAWGSHHLVIGGSNLVKGAAMYGTFPTLDLNGPDDAGEGRWIPTTSVDQYGATMASWFGVDQQNMVKVFPNIANFKQQNLGFLG